MRYLLIFIVIVGVIYYLTQCTERIASPTGSPYAAATPAPLVRPIPSDYADQLRRAAQDAGVQITDLQIQQGGALVTLSWGADVPARGGEFLTLCLDRQLMRNFAEEQGLSMKVVDGRSICSASYQINY
jgi:hypothetical protein